MTTRGQKRVLVLLLAVGLCGLALFVARSHRHAGRQGNASLRREVSEGGEGELRLELGKFQEGKVAVQPAPGALGGSGNDTASHPSPSADSDPSADSEPADSAPDWAAAPSPHANENSAANGSAGDLGWNSAVNSADFKAKGSQRWRKLGAGISHRELEALGAVFQIVRVDLSFHELVIADARRAAKGKAKETGIQGAGTQGAARGSQNAALSGDSSRNSKNPWAVLGASISPGGERGAEGATGQAGVGAGERKSATVSRLADEIGALAAINGTFFDENERPLGWLVSRGEELNPLRPISWWAALVVLDEGQKRRATVLTPAQLASLGEGERKKVNFALQVGPRTVTSGSVIQLKRQFAARSLACVQGNGSVLLAVSQGAAVESNAVAELMAKSEEEGGLACVDGLMLDGGPSAQLVVNTAALQLNTSRGRPVPNAIAVLPLAGMGEAASKSAGSKSVESKSVGSTGDLGLSEKSGLKPESGSKLRSESEPGTGFGAESGPGSGAGSGSGSGSGAGSRSESLSESRSESGTAPSDSPESSGLSKAQETPGQVERSKNTKLRSAAGGAR